MRKKKIPLASATAAQLKKIGLQRKNYIFPVEVAEAIEAQAEKEDRFETRILIDSFRAYRKEFEAFISQMEAAKNAD